MQILDGITIATGFPDSIVIFSLGRLKMHTSYNFLDIHNDGINPFTLSIRREMCSLESFSSRGWSCFVYIRLPFWRHRACIATYSWGRPSLRAQRGFRNWPRVCVRSRGWTRHHARMGSHVAPRASRSRATPRVRDGASNHGSWRKNVVNFHSTTII